MGLTQLHKIKEKERFFNVSFENMERRYRGTAINFGFTFVWRNRPAKITGAVYNEEKYRYDYICQYND